MSAFRAVGPHFLQRRAAATSITRLTALVADLAMEHFPLHAATLALRAAGSEKLEHCTFRGIADALIDDVAVVAAHDPLIAAARASSCITTERAVFGTYEEYLAAIARIDLPDHLRRLCLRPYTIVPLVDAEGFAGCLQLNGMRLLDDDELHHLALLCGQASACLAVLQERPTLERASAVASLHERELEMVQLLAQGLTNVELALSFDIGIDAVKKVLKRVYRKLHVASRAEAVGLVHGCARGLDAPRAR